LFSEKKHNFLYIEQKYGGHLGFYEGGLIYPNPLTWLDRTVVDLASAITAYATSEKAELILDQENG
jgi:abhydrolase domain-containing protein 2